MVELKTCSELKSQAHLEYTKQGRASVEMYYICRRDKDRKPLSTMHGQANPRFGSVDSGNPNIGFAHSVHRI